jgi:hypothetical protein
MTPRSTALGWSAAAIALFFVFLHTAILSPDGFFSGDQGAKYLQALAFAEHPLNPGVDVRSRDVDPEFHYQILANRQGRLVATFSWLLPILTAPFLRLLGTRGVYVVPVLSAVAIFLSAAALGRRLGVGTGLWSAWVVVLAAPVLVYGAELWEHAPAAACVMIAALLFAPDRSDRRRFVAAGACLAVGALFREEAIVALPAFVLARAMSARGTLRWKEAIGAGLLATLGVAAVFIATVPLNLFVYGSVLPLHVTSEIAKTGSYADMRLTILKFLMLPYSFVPAFVVALAVLVACAGARAWHRHGVPPTFPRLDGGLLVATVLAVAALLTIGVLIPVWRMTVGGLPAFWSYRVESIAHTWLFCLALPFLGWLGHDDVRADVARFIAIGAVLLMIGTLAIIPSPGGAQWSPRYLFVVAPLLAVLSSAPARQVSGLSAGYRAVVLWTARTALGCSFVAQAWGVYYLADAKARNARITEQLAFLASPQEVVITNVPWFPQVTATLLPTYRVLLAFAPAQVAEIAELAAARGYASIAFVGCTPETGYIAPSDIFASKSRCRYERVNRLPIGERVLTFDRYSCRWP